MFSPLQEKRVYKKSAMTSSFHPSFLFHFVFVSFLLLLVSELNSSRALYPNLHYLTSHFLLSQVRKSTVPSSKILDTIHYLLMNPKTVANFRKFWNTLTENSWIRPRLICLTLGGYWHFSARFRFKFWKINVQIPHCPYPKGRLQMPHHRFILDDQMPLAQGNSKETIWLFLTINARLSSALQADSADRT